MDHKNHNYKVVRLDHESNEPWAILTQKRPATGAVDAAEAPEQAQEDMGDIAYENRKNRSIISIDSVCQEHRSDSLEDLTRYLLLGLNVKSEAALKDIEADGVKAMQATVDASMPGESPVRIRTVVLKKSGCVYDLMYIAKPEVFEDGLSTFDRFIKGFHAQ